MKNKLLLSSALVSGLLAGSSAIAQTSITGSLDIHYRALSFNGTGTKSTQGFGRESQVNVQNKGKLNNGMDYAAGFSLEFDGGNNLVPAGANTATTLNEGHSISNENLYVDFISGTTTFTVGVDHVQNSTRHSAPMIRNVLDDVPAFGGVATDQIGSRTKESMYFGIVQALPGTGITLSAINAPQTGAFGSTDQAINSGSENNPSYEIGFQGVNTMGVKGLNTHAYTNKMKGANGGTDLKGTTYGIGYSFGEFAAGVDVHKTNRSNTTATTEVTMKNTLYGVTYAATKELSVGLIYSKNTIDAAAAPEAEKVKTVQVGYNLGPVSIIGHYDMFDGVAGAATAVAEGKQAGIRISTLF
jgi:hypothetical protein